MKLSRKIKTTGAKLRTKAKDTQGLTTVEMIVLTLVIIVLISVVVVPSMTKQITTSTEASDKKIEEIINYDGK